MPPPAIPGPADLPPANAGVNGAPREELVRQILALQTVVKLERKLRQRTEQTTRSLRQQLEQAVQSVQSAPALQSGLASWQGGEVSGQTGGGGSGVNPEPASTASGTTSAHSASIAQISGAGSTHNAAIAKDTGADPSHNGSIATATSPSRNTFTTPLTVTGSHSRSASHGVASGAFDPDATRIASSHTGSGGSVTPDEAELLPLPPGFMLHEYRIDAVLGQGGFGITYLATDVNLNTRFAIKEYLPATFALRALDHSVFPRFAEDNANYYGGLDSFLLEARTLATFRHPNIVRVARFFEAHHTAYIVLDYERGQSLKDWWPAHMQLPESELLALLQPLLDGLAQVHATGYLHRDIKPDNIMLRESDGSMVLLDFGAARQSGGKAELEVVLTPGYAPKEQYLGQAQGPWTDIYAFGATLYWLVAGHKPLSAPERVAQTQTPAQELGKGRFSGDFLQAIDWALQPEALERPQTVAEFGLRLFAAHSTSLGLQEALRIGESKAAGGPAQRRGLSASLQGSQRLGMRLLHGAWQTLAHVVHVLSHPAAWPLGVKMTLAMVLAALLPMTITAYYNLKGSVASVSDSELRNLERLAQATAGRVTQLLGDSRHLANYIGLDADFIGYLRAPDANGQAVVENKIRQLLAANPDVHRLILLDRQGKALVSNDAAVIGSNNQFRQYFREAMAGRSFITGLVVSHVDGTSGVYYTNPVFDAQHQVVGVIVLRIKGSTIANILNDSTSGSGRMPFLLDGDGIMIYHPDPSFLYHSLTPLSRAKAQEIRDDRRFGPKPIQSLNMPDLASAMVAAKTHGNLSYRSSLSNTEEHAGYAPVAGHNWVVGITEPRSQFEAPLNRLFQNVLWSVALVGLLFMLLAWLFARSIVRPVLRLTQAANALKEGDFDKASIASPGEDEIGRLARTFNVMIDVLRQRERERKQPNRPRGNP